MCQAIRDGGRRCPVHQHQNRAFIDTASATTELTNLQSERLFAELRREGRNSVLRDDEARASVFTDLRRVAGASEENALLERVNSQLEKSETHDEDIDGASDYAQGVFLERAKTRAENMAARFQEVADRTGLSRAEVAAKFEEFTEAVDTSRNAEVPAEYNQNTRRAAVIANLPYDKSSVVAWEKLKTLPEASTTRRVVHTPVVSSFIESAGYDEGRMEVIFQRDPERIYAYNNVPESLWEDFRDGGNSGSVYSRLIRNNEDYRYLNEEEAEADAFSVRCASCGQFRAASHACPAREVRAELDNVGAPAEEIQQVAEQTLANQPDSMRVDESVSTEVEELVPAPEPVENASVTADDAQNATNEPETVVIVPAAHIASPAPLRRNMALTPGAENMPNLVTSNADETNPEYVVTAENQLEPNPYDSGRLLVASSGDKTYKHLNFVTKDNLARVFSAEPDELLGTELYNTIMNAPESIQFIIGQETNEAPVTLLHSYDSNTHHAVQERDYGSGLGWFNSPHIYKVFQLARQAPVTPFTEEEDSAAKAAEQAIIEPLVESGDATVIPATASFSRRFNIDANLNRQPLVNVGNTVAFRRAIRENKVAVLPVQMKLTDYVSNGVDDQGYTSNHSNGTIVSGQMAFRKNANGVIEPITSERSLKCNCWDYRYRYYCSHVNYAYRHMGNVAAQMLPVRETVRTPIDPNRHRFLTTGLANRDDVTVASNDDGSEYISFGDALGYDSRTEYSYNYSDRILVPANVRPADPDNITPDETVALYNYLVRANQLSTITVPNSPGQLRVAIKRADVQFPILVNFGYSEESANVSGHITLNQNNGNLEDTTVKTKTLRCTCAEYRENYDCRHVRLVTDQAFAAITSGARNVTAEENSLHRANVRYRSEINQQRAIAEWIGHGYSREEAERIAADAAEADRLRREIHERQREAERQAREERYRIQAEEAAERRRTLNLDTIANAETYRAGMLERWNNVEDGSYTENPSNFYEDYKAALSRKRAGGEAIEFKTENVTDGVCADVPGARQFGIELEFDIKPGVNKSNALRKIGQELKEAGLTASSSQGRYHSARNSGWANWSFEHDVTVDAELVSPIMKDTPEHWEQLRKATEIISRNGGIATTRTGSHVHVSTASYESSSAKHVELLRTVNQNDDLIYRLASNPASGKHRGTQWCAPNANDNSEDIPADLATANNILGGHSSHGVAMNFEGTAQEAYKKSNIEFRMWDGSIDPAVIQQQVAISAAITDYAERNVIANNGSKKPTESRVAIGTNRVKEQAAMNGSRTHTEESFHATSGEAAAFFDKIFRTKAGRAGAAALFAVTNWQEPVSRRSNW